MRNRFALLFITLGLLTACSGSPTPTPDIPTLTPTTEATPTPADPLAILILPADLPQSASDEFQTLVYDLAQGNGMRFQVRNTLTVEELQAELPALKIIVALPPDPGLAALAAAAPGVQFLAVDIPEVTAGGNLSTIGGADQPVDKQAFLAGYIAAMLAFEWRVGILSERDTPGGESARTAFANGYHYFCGDCRNQNFSWPWPVNGYPIVARIPTDAQESEYYGYAAALLDYNSNIYASVIYVYPEVATSDVFSYLAEKGVLLLGQELLSEDLRSNWIASIQPNVIPAIQSIFPDLLAGNGGRTVPTPLYLTDVNEGLLTEGKLRLAQEVLDGLQSGTIGTGVNP
ncbi:MAG: hypothetical protein AB1531_03300 [Chloroflexota bacterium]